MRQPLAAAAILLVAGCGPAATPEPRGPQSVPAAAMASGRWIDLTHAFGPETIYWPTERGFVLEREFAGTNPKGYYYAANRIATAEHGGTHLDAPRHFAEGRKTADEIDPGRLVGEAVVIDVGAVCRRSGLRGLSRRSRRLGAGPRPSVGGRDRAPEDGLGHAVAGS